MAIHVNGGVLVRKGDQIFVQYPPGVVPEKSLTEWLADQKKGTATESGEVVYTVTSIGEEDNDEWWNEGTDEFGEPDMGEDFLRDLGSLKFWMEGE